MYLSIFLWSHCCERDVTYKYNDDDTASCCVTWFWSQPANPENELVLDYIRGTNQYSTGQDAS